MIRLLLKTNIFLKEARFFIIDGILCIIKEIDHNSAIN